MKNINLYPAAISGLTLGILGIGSFWKIALNNNIIAVSITIIVSILATIMLLPLLLKMLRHPNVLLDELAHPVVGSTIPTFAMSLMVLSNNLLVISRSFATILWLLAIILHLLFLFVFLYNRFKNFNLHHIVPSWYVPPIGIVVACLTIPNDSYLWLAKIICWFGLISYFIMLPTMLFRLSLREILEDAKKPTLAILAAPASLTLAGYITVTTNYNPLIIMALFGIAITMTVSVYLMLIHLLKLPFSPAYAAFTFPLAISATASIKFSIWSKGIDILQGYTQHLYQFALVEGILASIVIMYVLSHYLKYITKNHIKIS
ncbi:TDT family transporter [Rickettsiales bacterium LUAb2]